MAYGCTPISFLRAVLGFTFLSVAWLSCRLLSNHTRSTLLKAARHKWFPQGTSRSNMYLWLVQWKVLRVVSAPAFMVLNLLVVSSLDLVGTDPSTMSYHIFSAVKWKPRLFALWSPALRSSWKSCWVLPCFPDVAPALSLGSSFLWCLPVLLDASSQMSAFGRSSCNISLALSLSPCRNGMAGPYSAHW